MANHGDRVGRLLEIAFGDFDEADIVRLHDDYARTDDDADPTSLGAGPPHRGRRAG